MDNLSGCKVVHIDSRRRIALQCVDLLLSGAAPARRTRIANQILVMCDGRLHSRRERKPRRMTPSLLSELIAVHSSCVHDQEGRCPLLVSVASLCWEINQAMGVANDEDRAFRRYDPMCAARPLGRDRFEEE
jgi:hypothetical protein